MNWRDYEEQVYRLLKVHLPYARLRKNVKIRGRYSGRKRQIDILISEPTGQGRVRTVVDAKHFSRKVDMKAVDSLAGFVDDVGADGGMLVTGKGYSKAALRRAFYGPSDLELDVLNFDELKRLQVLREIGHWYRDMGDFMAAREALEECISLEPRAYHALKELILVVKKLGDEEAVRVWLGRLLRLDPHIRLDPHNPTVYNDALDFVRRGPVTPRELVALMDEPLLRSARATI